MLINAHCCIESECPWRISYIDTETSSCPLSEACGKYYWNSVGISFTFSSLIFFLPFFILFVPLSPFLSFFSTIFLSCSFYFHVFTIHIRSTSESYLMYYFVNKTFCNFTSLLRTLRLLRACYLHTVSSIPFHTLYVCTPFRAQSLLSRNHSTEEHCMESNCYQSHSKP